MTDVRNTDAVIDSRDIITRIEELQKELEGVVLNEDTDIYELDGVDVDSEHDELTALLDLQSEAEESPDWVHGETLISKDYFTDYTEELVKDCGYISHDLPSWIAIDWYATAENVKLDCLEVDFDGETYFIRG